jgi:hypothetical protein
MEEVNEAPAMVDQTGTAESVQENAIDAEDELIASLIAEPGYTGKPVVNAENKQDDILFIEPDGGPHP